LFHPPVKPRALQQLAVGHVTQAVQLEGSKEGLGVTKVLRTAVQKFVRRRMIWNIRGDFGAEVIGSSGLGYAA
jgi:hypothetical protein